MRILLLLCFLLAAFRDLSADDRIGVGVSSALTGNASSWGVDLKNAIAFAADKIAPGRYNLIFEDDKCNGRYAATVAHRFADVLKVKYVVGFACSSTILSSADIYNRSGIVAIVMSASAAEISKRKVFRTWPSDAMAAQTLFDYVTTRHKKFGVLSEQTDYAQGFLRSMELANKDKKIELVNENFLTEQSDFRTVLLKLKSKGVDGIFLNTQSEATFLAALKQARTMGTMTPLYSAYWAGTSVVLEDAGNDANGVVFVDPPPAAEIGTPEGMRLFEEFQEKYGRMNSVEVVFMTAFEGMRALHLAIESGENVKQFLHRTTFDGLFGKWSFDENGDIRGFPFVMKSIMNGQPTLLNKIPETRKPL